MLRAQRQQANTTSSASSALARKTGRWLWTPATNRWRVDLASASLGLATRCQQVVVMQFAPSAVPARSRACSTQLEHERLLCARPRTL